MPFVVSNGVRLNTSRLGQGPPIVMIHGLLVGNLASWYFSAAPALARRYSVLLYDLRGHGRSERPPTGYDLPEMTRDLVGLVSDEEVPLSLVGHSYGALVALNFAIQFPNRVDRLVLVDAPLPPSEFTELNEFAQLDPAQMVQSMPSQVQAMVTSGGRRTQRFVGSLAELTGNTSLLKDLQAEPDVTNEQLGKIGCPVLAVYGKQSACRPVADRLEAVIPDCQKVLLDGGHFLPLEAPDQLVATMLGFFNG